MVTRMDIWPLINELMTAAKEQKDFDFYGSWPIPTDKLQEILDKYLSVGIKR